MVMVILLFDVKYVALSPSQAHKRKESSNVSVVKLWRGVYNTYGIVSFKITDIRQITSRNTQVVELKLELQMEW